MRIPKVSVVCAWYNRADYIRDTVDSLLNQTFDNYEVIIVNDGSSDPRVRAILDSYTDLRLKVIHQENTGFTKALKNAIQASAGEFIAIQGAGDISHPERLIKQVNIFLSNPAVGIVGCFYVKKNIQRPELLETLMPSSQPFGGKALHNLLVSHGELMYRRSIYEAVGGYREFFVVGQGTDLWERMLRHSGLEIVSEVLYEQRIFEDGVSTNYAKIFHRSLLHGVMLEEKKAIFAGVSCPVKDVDGIFMPLYLTSRKELSKRYLTIMLICYALKLPESSYYRKLAVVNSSFLYSVAAWLLGYIPLKSFWAKFIAARSTIYTRLMRDINGV